MRRLLTLVVSAAALAPAVSAQDMIGVTINGDVHRVDSVTGAYSLLGPSGFNLLNCLAKASDGKIYSVSASTTSLVPSRLIELDPQTGAGTQIHSLQPLNVSAAAFDAQDRLFLIVYNASSMMDLWWLDRVTGALTFVAPLPVAAQPLQSMTFANGWLWAWSNTDSFCTNAYGIGLVRIDPATGALTDAAGLGDPACGDVQAMGTGAGGQMYAAGNFLYSVNSGTGGLTAIGPNNPADLRGIEFVGGSGGFSLAAAGTVPGQVTLTASGATPGGNVAVLYGNAGVFVKNGNPCNGLVLDIAQPMLGGMLTANGAGIASLTFNAPPVAAGKTVQAVDVSTCAKSNPVVL